MTEEHKKYWPMDKSVVSEPEKKGILLEDLRRGDPQAAIDYIMGRKELWKKKALEFQATIAQLKKDLAKAKKKSSHWKKQFEKEFQMRQWWKFATLATSICAAVMMVVMICLTMIMTSGRAENIPVRVPTSGIVQRTPNHVLASVILMNGDMQGSGTVISKGPDRAAVLTTAHLFKGVIGGKFWLYYVDGTYVEATLLAIDKQRDLALASVDSKTILTHAYVPSALIEGEDITGCGFTNGRGPIFKTLTYQRQWRENTGRYIWQMRVDSGEFSSGDSGGGIFQGNALIGITNSRNYCGSKRLYACPHHEIVKFLNENSSVLADCGDWSVLPEGQYGASDANAPPQTPMRRHSGSQHPTCRSHYPAPVEHGVPVTSVILITQ